MKAASIAGFLACVLVALLATPSSAGNFLDDYINNIKLDQQSANAAEPRDLVPGHSIGQTFTTGPEVVEVYQIMVAIDRKWNPGTLVVLALYDSPDKTNKLGEFQMKYEWRMCEDNRVVFPIKAKVEPNHAYYFELTADGADAKAPVITSSDYTAGQAYIDGKPLDIDLYFETYVHTAWDRDKVYADQFAKFNLDHPGMDKVKAAVQAKDWDAAAKELVAHFESRADLMEETSLPKDGKKPTYDAAVSDMAANATLKDADGNMIDLGPNWNHLRWWPTRGGVGLTREGIRKPITGAYAATGDEKYAIAWNSLLKGVFIDIPSPLKAGVIPADAKDISPVLKGGINGGSMWSGLAIAARMRHGFWYYKTFTKSPNFPWDVRAAFIMNLVDMADVLAIEKGGGNWADQMNMGLFEFGVGFPEYTRAKEFAQQGFDGLITSMRDTLLPDGPIGESAGYQCLVNNTYLTVLTEARENGLVVPDDIRKKVEAALLFNVYTVQPDGCRPPFGDALRDDIRKMMQKASDELHNDEMLWVATDGKQGKTPKKTSVEFPYSKYYVMRSDWTPDQRYLCLKNGRYTSHGHRDSLGFVMYGYGNPLLVDPGIYIYGTPNTFRLMETRSHCSVSVDGSSLVNGGGPNSFFPGSSIDYICSQGPEYEKLDPSIYTVRRLAFVKPDYWVMSDVVRGEGTHQVDSHFHFANTLAALDPATQVATTQYTTGGNLAVIPVNPSPIASELQKADTAFIHEKLADALILKQSANTGLPFRNDNVLYPYKGASADARVEALKGTNADVETSGTRISTASGTDWVLFTGKANGDARFEATDASAAAQCAVIRTDKQSKVRSFAWVWGSKIAMGKRLLASSARLMQALDVTYEGDTVLVKTLGPDPSLQIASLGARFVVVDDYPAKPLKSKSGFFQPFAGESPAFVLTDNELPGFAIEKPIKGSTAGGEDQTGFNYIWANTSPGRESLMSYSPSLPSDGLYEVSAFVPHTQIVGGVTEEAHYIVKFKPGAKWFASKDKRVKLADASKASDGVVEMRVDQSAAVGTWVSLGVFGMDKASAKLEIRADAPHGAVLLADGVKWQLR